MDPKYLNCPIECEDDPKRFDAGRREFCDGCDAKRTRDTFKQDVLELFEERLECPQKFDFDKLLQTLGIIMRMEEKPPEKLSVKNSELLEIYLSEKNKKDFIDRWNERKDKETV